MKEWATLDVCRNLFGEGDAEQGSPCQKKQTSRRLGASLDVSPAPALLEEGEQCRENRSPERSGGGYKSLEKGGDSRTRVFRHGEDKSARNSAETVRLQNTINEMRAQISASVRNAVEAAEARLAAQFLTAIVPSYDDLRQRVGAIESRILGVPDTLSARVNEGQECHGQQAEHFPLAWPEGLDARLAALEKRSDGISALEQAVADLRLPLTALESKLEFELQMTARAEARAEPTCDTLRNRVVALEQHCAAAICDRPLADVQEAINSSERRLLNELQAVRTENTERVQVLSSQLLEVRVAALQAQSLHDAPSPWRAKAADSKQKPTNPLC